MNFNEIIDENKLQKFHNFIERRAKNEPLQYILGYVYFCDIRLKVNKFALIPRPETEQLVDTIIKICSNFHTNFANILDICTGSGCIALSLAKKFENSAIDAIDISENAIELAKENQQNLNLKNVNFIQKDIKDFDEKKKYDLIVCNPPYVTINDYNKLEAELFFEPKIALTDNSDGLTFYKIISEKINDILAKNGKLFFECGINQADEICEIYEKMNFKTTKMKDFNQIDRFIMIEN
jgi:release factor glutamine methyltransferase